MCFWAYADSKGSDQPEQPEQGLRSPLTESSNTIEYINGEQMPRWDFGDAWGESVRFAQAQTYFHLAQPKYINHYCLLTLLSAYKRLRTFCYSYAIKSFLRNNGWIYQGPVVQSVVSLTNSFWVISLTVLADSIYNILIFFAEKMWVAFALQKLLTFFQQKISVYLHITWCTF